MSMISIINKYIIYYLFYCTINVRARHVRSVKRFDGSEFSDKCKHANYECYFLPIFHFFKFCLKTKEKTPKT